MKTFLQKQYDGESVVDVERDVYEALNDSDVPVDEYGFAKGVFTVTITWSEE